MQARWQQGIFIGVRVDTNEKLVATEEGCHVAQSVRRKPLDERWSAEALEKIRGTPWEPIPKGPDRTELPYPLEIRPDTPEAPQPAPEGPKAKVAEKQFYIQKKDLEKHGYTAGCPACIVTRLNRPRQGSLHTQECRLRLEEALSRDEEAQGSMMIYGERLEKRARTEQQPEEAEDSGGASGSGPGPHTAARGEKRQATDSE